VCWAQHPGALDLLEKVTAASDEYGRKPPESRAHGCAVPTAATPRARAAKIEVNNLNFFYNKFHALKNINLRFPKGR
jgi:ABC-type multidrug transport system fused ATPase/permease subunit